MNDDDLRRSAHDARWRAIETTDVDAGLAEVRARIASGGSSAIVGAVDHPSARRWPVWAAAVAVIAVVIGAGVIFTRPDGDTTIRIVDVPTPSNPSAPTVLLLPSTTVPTTSAPISTKASNTDPPQTTQPSLPPTQTISVSYADPPELVEPRVIASIPLEPNPDRSPLSVAIGENEIAVSQPGTPTVTLIGYEVGAGTATSERTVEVAEVLNSTVFGPGDVLYGFGDITFTDPESAVPDFRFVAIPLSGDRQGQVVAERLLSAVRYTELGPGSFGHGVGGVIDRARNVNATIIGYRDVSGAPLSWAGEPPPLIGSEFNGLDLSVVVFGTDLTWNLAIDRSPTNGGDFIGPGPPAPTSGGRVVYSENVGDDLTPNQDFGPSAMPVVAILEPDGSGRWIRLPDGWSVVANDVWGTVLARTTDTTLELALLDDLVPPD